MTRDFLIQKLKEKGITTKIVQVSQNGFLVEGIVVGDEDIRPTIYENMYQNIKEEEIDFFIKEIISYMNNPFPFHKEDIQNFEWVKPKLHLCLQQKTKENIIKRDFLDLEQCIRVNLIEDGSLSFKITPQLLEIYNVSKEEIFNIATENTKNLLEIYNIADIIAKHYNLPNEIVELMNNTYPTMLLLTTFSKRNGSIALCYPEILEKVASIFQSDYFIIPSSIHECIVFPFKKDITINEINKMIQYVNKNELSPEEFLSNHVYLYKYKDKKIILK